MNANTLIIQLLIITLISISCQDDSKIKNDSSKENNSLTKEDTIASVKKDNQGVDSLPPKSTNFTMEAMIEGADSDLYFDEKPSTTDLQNEAIDIIPYDHPGDGIDEGIESSMMVIARDNFRFYDPLSEYTGQVNMYFDRKKKYKMTSFELVNGSPEGWCVLRNPDNEIYFEKEYKNGELIDVGIAPFAMKWNFNQANSSLEIEDFSNAVDIANNDKVVNIMPSIYFSPDNYFDKIIEKTSFQKPFLINGEAYTGTLNGYQHPIDFDESIVFELNFKDGYLHGDIKLYTWWGELKLHETFENGELIEQIFVLDESEMDGVAKPIIYLYPEKITDVSVKLTFDGELTHTYPRYPKTGWQVQAHPDGTLFDKKDKEYYALYWEGKENIPFNITNGNILKGSETVSFLEDALPTLGLSPRETNEFIIYWMPQMVNNKYNLIHFSTEEYETMAKLDITPKPETIIRVMMVFKPLDHPVEIKKQDITKLSKVRNGFTVVEWGGRKIKSVKI